MSIPIFLTEINKYLQIWQPCWHIWRHNWPEINQNLETWQPCCRIRQPYFSAVFENCTAWFPFLKNIGIHTFNSIIAIICRKLIKSLEIWQPCCRIWQPCCSDVIQNGTVRCLIFKNMGIPIFSFLMAISWLKWKTTWTLATF